MKRRSRAASFVLLTLAGLLLASPAVSQTGPGSQAAFFRDMAAQDRAHAADARQRAKEWEDMAAKAQARAAAASGSLKESWEQIAKDDANSAKELNDEAETWKQKAGQLDAQAEQAEKQAAAANPTAAGSGVAANPNPPMTKERPASDDPIAELVGQWLDQARGTIVTIERPTPGSGQSLILKGKHGDWKGTYTAVNGSQPARLAFRRKPNWKEMDDAAPDWARRNADGKLEWILELDVGGDCMPRLGGKW